MNRLVLTRKVGERVQVKMGDVTFYVSPVQVTGKNVRMLFEDAPLEVEFLREELLERDAA